MLAALSASLLVLAADITPPAGAMCVQSKFENGDYVTYVIPAARLAEFSDKAIAKQKNFAIIPCPIKWSAAQTSKLCEAVDGFSDDLKAAMTEIYAISPDEMCEAAHEVDRMQAERKT